MVHNKNKLIKKHQTGGKLEIVYPGYPLKPVVKRPFDEELARHAGDYRGYYGDNETVQEVKDHYGNLIYSMSDNPKKYDKIYNAPYKGGHVYAGYNTNGDKYSLIAYRFPGTKEILRYHGDEWDWLQDKWNSKKRTYEISVSPLPDNSYKVTTDSFKASNSPTGKAIAGVIGGVMTLPVAEAFGIGEAITKTATPYITKGINYFKNLITPSSMTLYGPGYGTVTKSVWRNLGEQALASMAGFEGMNLVSKSVTGKPWGDALRNILPDGPKWMPEWGKLILADATNIGGWASPNTFYKAYNTLYPLKNVSLVSNPNNQFNIVNPKHVPTTHNGIKKGVSDIITKNNNTTYNLKPTESVSNTYTQDLIDLLGNSKTVQGRSTDIWDDAYEEFAQYLAKQGVNISKFSKADLYTLMNMREKSVLTNLPKNGRVATVNSDYRFNDYNLFDNLQHIGNMQTYKSKGNLHIAFIGKSQPSSTNVSVDLYDAALKTGPEIGTKGLISGETLVSPEMTTHIWKKYYPHRKIIGKYGNHTYNVGRDVIRTGDLKVTNKGLVVDLVSPSKDIPVKNLRIFHPSMIDRTTKTLKPPRWNDPDIYKMLVPGILGYPLLQNNP